MPGKCYREVNGVQRTGTRSTRKNGKRYCKLDRAIRKDKGTRRELGVNVGRQYGKTFYRSTCGAFFYCNSTGKKTYISAARAKEAGFLDHLNRNKVTSHSILQKDVSEPKITGHVEPKKVSARASVVNSTSAPKNESVGAFKRSKADRKEMKKAFERGESVSTLGERLGAVYKKYNTGFPDPPDIPDSVFEEKRKEAQANKEKRESGKTKKKTMLKDQRRVKFLKS